MLRLHTPLFDEEPGDAGGGGGAPLTAGATPPAEPTPTPDASPFSGLLDSDGNFTEGAFDKLPDDQFNDLRATLANYKSFPAMAAALKESKTAAMQKAGIKPPTAESTPEEIAEFHKAIGVPDSPEGYGLEAPDQLPEGVEWSDDFAASFTGKAHELGLTPAQVQGLQAWHLEQESERALSTMSAGEQTREEALNDLRATYGDKFDEAVSKARIAANAYGVDPDNSPLLASPEGVKLMVKLHAGLNEDQIVAGRSSDVLNPESKAKDIMTNPQNPLYERYRSGDPEVVSMVNSQLAAN